MRAVVGAPQLHDHLHRTATTALALRAELGDLRADACAETSQTPVLGVPDLEVSTLPGCAWARTRADAGAPAVDASAW